MERRRAGRVGLVAWPPRAVVEEDGRQFVVRADLRGVAPRNVHVSVVENALVGPAQAKEQAEKRKNCQRVERCERQFSREPPLLRGIEAYKIQAKSANDVVTVTNPKKAEAQPTKIAMQAEK